MNGSSLHFWLNELWHPLRGGGYQFWSGLGSDISEVMLVGAGIAAWHKLNCHEHRCLRIAWHKDTDGHPVCKVHHPDHPARSWFRTDRNHPRHSRNRFV